MNSEDEDSENGWEHLNTVTKFDVPSFSNPSASTQVVNTGIYEKIAAKATTPVSLLVESLVQQLCAMLETDPKRSVNLYNSICERLHHMNLIDETYAMGEFEMMRSQYQRALYQLVSIARGQDLPVDLQSVWPLTQPLGFEWSRYHRDFEELSFIAGGGFGKVYRARHNLDGFEYAVKKITIKSTTINSVLLHLAEVKTLASLNHINIVPYKAAWLEPLLANTNDEVGGDQVDGVGTQDDDDEEEDSESVFNSKKDSFYRKDDSSDFIEFVESESNSRNLRKEENNKLVEVKENQFQETPHLKLKWAILYIQMTLCHLTLREWLDERNKHDDFGKFYNSFIRNPKNCLRTVIPNNSFCRRTVHLNSNSTSSGSSEEVLENGVCSEEKIANQDADHIEIVTEILSQLLNGLNYIHSRGIVHHDIKPSNIFVSLEDNNKLNIQLGDFGLACPLQKAHCGAGFGTPMYAAPEQLEGRCDPKSDIYSLGIILLELLLNFSTDMERAAMIKDVRRGKLPQDLDTNFANILKSLLNLRSTKRPSTAQLVEAVNSLKVNKDKVIVELQERLTLQEEEIQTLKSQIDDNNFSLEIELRSKSTEILKKEQELRIKSMEIDLKMEELQIKDNEIQSKTVSIASKDLEIRLKDEEISRLKMMLQMYQSSENS